MAGLKDWTQVLYQLGLGVAAWDALRIGEGSTMNETTRPTCPKTMESSCWTFSRPWLKRPGCWIYGPLIVGTGLRWASLSFTPKPSYIAVNQHHDPQQQQGAAAAVMAQLGALAGMARMGSGPKSPARVVYRVAQEQNNCRDRMNRPLQLDARAQSRDSRGTPVKFCPK